MLPSVGLKRYTWIRTTLCRPRVPAEGARRAGVLWEQRAAPGAEPAQPGLTTRRWFMLRVLLYENTGKLTACGSLLEGATYEASRRLSSNGHAGRLVTTEQPWAESMKAYPGMTVARPITVQLRE